MAEAFYESKVVEACALIVDWRLAYGRAPVALSADDVAAVAAAQRLIQQDLAHPVTTEELCRAVCVGTSKLIELFRLSCGMTPQEYARDVRMHHACELLETTDLSLAAAMEKAERDILSNALTNYKSTRAIAKVLQVSQPTIVRKLHKYGLSGSEQ